MENSQCKPVVTRRAMRRAYQDDTKMKGDTLKELAKKMRHNWCNEELDDHEDDAKQIEFADVEQVR